METLTQTRQIVRGQQLEVMRHELARVATERVDMILPVLDFALDTDGTFAYREQGEKRNTPLNRWALGQFTAYAGLPSQYFTQLVGEDPALASRVAAHELGKKRAEVMKTGKHDGRLVRILDNNVQAIVSPSFFTLDSHDILEKVLPILNAHRFEVISCELTDRRFYLKATTPRIQGEVKVGDVVQYGVVISSSDVGAGSIRIEPFALRLVCLNGAIFANTYKRNHRSSKQEPDSVRRLYREETLQLEKASELSKISDTLNGSLTQEVFSKELEKMRLAAGMELSTKAKAEAVVSSAADIFGITSKEVKNEIESNLVRGNEGAGWTLWGLANSFTAAAKSESVSFDDSINLERAAGQLLELTPKSGTWTRIANAH